MYGSVDIVFIWCCEKVYHISHPYNTIGAVNLWKRSIEFLMLNLKMVSINGNIALPVGSAPISWKGRMNDHQLFFS